LVGLGTTRADPESPDERGRYDSDFVFGLQSSIGHSKGFGASLENDPAPGLSTQEPTQMRSGASPLRYNLLGLVANTDPGLPSAEIDRNMMHGCLLGVRL
jgi:hypothetical protein